MSALTPRRGDADAADKTLRCKKRAIFGSLATLAIIINLDGGAVPQALLYIQETFELTILQARTRRQIAPRSSTQF